jgi:hypothetical protein
MGVLSEHAAYSDAAVDEPVFGERCRWRAIVEPDLN